MPETTNPDPMIRLARGMAARFGLSKLFPKGGMSQPLKHFSRSEFQKPRGPQMPVTGTELAAMTLGQLYAHIEGIRGMNKMAEAWQGHFGGAQELARMAREMGGTAPVVFEIDNNTGRMRALRDVRDVYGSTPFEDPSRFAREASRANRMTPTDLNMLKRWKVGRSHPQLRQ
jgi:hypothetical protein